MLPLVKKLNEKLEGLPDNILTVMLIALALFALGTAIWGKPAQKALLAAWFIAP